MRNRVIDGDRVESKVSFIYVCLFTGELGRKSLHVGLGHIPSTWTLTSLSCVDRPEETARQTEHACL